MKRQSALLLVNRRARAGGSDIGPVTTLLGQGGIDVVGPGGDIPAWQYADCIREAGSSVDMVIVGGGDGTLSSCAKAVAETGKPLGVLPLGTANDLARTLRIPIDLVGATQVIIGQKSSAVDLGLVNGHPFFNVATVGLAADLAAGLTSETKKRWGRFGYALGALRLMLGANRFTAWIKSASGNEQVKTYQIAVGNGRHYGGGAIVHTDATIHDGMLDLYSLELKALWKLAILFPVFKRGDHGKWDEVRIDYSSRFEITTRRPQPINADGEIVTQTPARFEVMKEALRLYVP